MKNISCIYHPSTVICIDDETKFIKSLSIILEDTRILHKMFDKPHKGLEYINADTYRQELVERLVVPNDEEEFCYQSDAIAHELFNQKRYDQISVLVVDYDMPGMTGLEVCERIHNPFVKKILLTGAADESLAIDAFNKGLIYQFIRKQDPQFIEKLQEAIKTAQQQYFQEISELPVRIMAARYDSTALVDPAFKAHFDNIVNKHRIVEYYLVEAMGNFIMIDDQRKIHCLMTLDEGLVEVYLNCKSSETLSAEQITAIEQKKVVPCYYDPFNQFGFENPQLGQYLHKPTVVQGAQRPYYCVFGQRFFPVDPNDIALR